MLAIAYLAFDARCLATTHYVDLSSSNSLPPYTNWATAATVIQDAVDAASAGDEVVVTNGVYATGGRSVEQDGQISRVAIDKPVSLRSMNGPDFTVIAGYQVPGSTNGLGAVRCVYLAEFASLSGFSITNGATLPAGGMGAYPSGRGAGILCESTGAVVSNCVIAGNVAAALGGGVFNGILKNCTIIGNAAAVAGGAYGSILVNCVLSTNLSRGYGGGASSCWLTNCTLLGNSAASEGGGVFDGALSDCNLIWNSARVGGAASGDDPDSCVLINCTVVGNSASSAGGGANSCSLKDCTLIGNSASGVGTGGDGGGVSFCIVSNCTLNGNSAGYGGGSFSSYLDHCLLSANSAVFSGGGGDSGGLANCVLTGNSALGGGGASPEEGGVTLTNCTVVGNWAQTGGGVEGGGDGIPPAWLANCIVYFNAAADGSDNYSPSKARFSFCCTTPAPPAWGFGPWGYGNITNEPHFVDQFAENLRLLPNSPCINAGNNGFPSGGSDLDGNRRIAGGTVDMGAYEFQNPSSLISYAWLQQYGFPIDGSADFLDSDGDGLNNWQEWRCGTDPTNAASALRLLLALPAGTNVTVTWQSVTGINYLLERSTNLGARAAFTTVVTNIAGLSGATTFTDTNAVVGQPAFYRVGVAN